MSSRTAARRAARRARVVLLFLLVPLRAHAEPAQFWLPLSVQAPITGSWRAAVESQVRWEDPDSDVDLLLVRPAILWAPSTRITVWAGYGLAKRFGPHNGREHGPWQQVTYSTTVGAWSLTPRLRLEERFVEIVVAWRLRAQVRASHPFLAGRWALLGWDEAFWNLGNAQRVVRAGFDQNRTFVGLQRRVSPRATIEPGYLLQVKESTEGRAVIHGALLAVATRF